VNIAHPGQPPQPHDLWSDWSLDPLVVMGITLVGTAYHIGRQRGRRRPRDAWRDRCFAAGLVAVAVALLSPLDQMSNTLASAHMVQHLLLVLVAAPLLAASTPSTALVRGTPAVVRRTIGRWRVRTGLTRRNTGLFRHPGAVWLLHVGSLWFWHASVPYDVALEHDLVHALEHATFLLTAVLFWGLVVYASRPGGLSPGFVVVLLFATAMQSVFLSALLTFAGTPWYSGYADTTHAWGLTPLADQQLAGVIMWIPGGVVYVVTALALIVAWIKQSEQPAPDRS
jgi:putative membrane protein